MKGPQVTAVAGFAVSVGMPCPHFYRNRLSAERDTGQRPRAIQSRAALRETAFSSVWRGASTDDPPRVVQAPDHQQRPEPAFRSWPSSAARPDPEGARTGPSRSDSVGAEFSGGEVDFGDADDWSHPPGRTAPRLRSQ